MNANNKSIIRWPLFVGYLGIVMFIMACAGIGVASSGDALLRLVDGSVEVRNDSGDWVSVASESTFEMVGELESNAPWTVAGTTFETRDSTQIDEGLEAGDLVRVKGAILEDDSWVAYSIERAEEQTGPTIILIGQATSIDPWVVKEITLNVTTDTVITGVITPGMLVRVEILLLEDGTWEVLSIAPFGNVSEAPDCATVMATVVSVNGNEIQFSGWPVVVTLAEDVKIESDEGEEGTLSENQVVPVVVCPSGDGQIVIVQIVILNTDDDAPVGGEGEKVLVCHKPDKKGGHTLSISSSAVPAHLGHGDKLGPCP
jgi:hypothetical protein